MTDLVKRLRRADTCIFPTERDRCHCGEAAARIEKLEAALQDVLHWADHCLQCDYDDDWAKIEKRARKALEGKDE